MSQKELNPEDLSGNISSLNFSKLLKKSLLKKNQIDSELEIKVSTSDIGNVYIGTGSVWVLLGTENKGLRFLVMIPVPERDELAFVTVKHVSNEAIMCAEYAGRLSTGEIEYLKMFKYGREIGLDKI